MSAKGVFLLITSFLIFIFIGCISNVKIAILLFSISTFIFSTIFLFSKKSYNKFIDYMYIVTPNHSNNRFLYSAAMYLVSIPLFYKSQKLNIKLYDKQFLSPYVLSGGLIILFILVASYLDKKLKNKMDSFIIYIIAGILSAVIFIWFVFYSTLVLGW